MMVHVNTEDDGYAQIAVKAVPEVVANKVSLPS